MCVCVCFVGKEDEKAKASSQPMGAGQGILGRGPSGSADDIKPVEVSTVKEARKEYNSNRNHCTRQILVL
eukprot:2789564-Amphidinium_carterae.1